MPSSERSIPRAEPPRKSELAAARTSIDEGSVRAAIVAAVGSVGLISVGLAGVACKRDEPSPVSSTVGIASSSASVAPSSSASGVPSYAGKYDSTEGPATIAQHDFDVTITYDGGHADCTAKETTLVCEWHEGQDYGLARLRRVGGGKLVGTWGTGKSETSGGEWTFVPAPP
jgi:hypothetical protein